MRRPVEGEVHVHYGQLYVESDPDSHGPGLAEAFAGQSSGLCGAAIPGTLWLTTGLHTGDVGFTVEVHDHAPPLDPSWEDVVEVSFRPASDSTELVLWGGEGSWDLGLDETDYRVRYCAHGMDAAQHEETRLDGEPPLDRYLLQFWPAPPTPDTLVKQTSGMAAYWHDYARTLPPPPTPAERAEAERQARLAREKAEREHKLAYERWEWGGRSPSRELSDVAGNVRGLLAFDAALVHTIDAAGPAAQRAVALLAARRACEAAALAELDWIAAGLTAVTEGRPLPPPLDDEAQVWRALDTDPRVPDRTVGRAVPPERPPFDAPCVGDEVSSPVAVADPTALIVGPAADWTPAPEPPEPPTAPPAEAAKYTVRVTMGEPDPSLRFSQPHMAIPALLAAAGPDPLRAALDAVYAAVVTYGEDFPALLRDVWSLCDGNRP
ncbi:hypothetical protein [Streptomyces sp. NPDC001135]